MSTQKQASRTPWTLVVGTCVLVLGAIGVANGTPTGFLLAVVGVVLVGTGLIQRTIRQSRD